MHEISPRFGDERTRDGIVETYVGNGRWVDRDGWRRNFAHAMLRSPARTYGRPPRLKRRDLACLMAEPGHQHCRRTLERD